MALCGGDTVWWEVLFLLPVRVLLPLCSLVMVHYNLSIYMVLEES